MLVLRRKDTCERGAPCQERFYLFCQRRSTVKGKNWLSRSEFFSFRIDTVSRGLGVQERNFGIKIKRVKKKLQSVSVSLRKRNRLKCKTQTFYVYLLIVSLVSNDKIITVKEKQIQCFFFQKQLKESTCNHIS